MSEKCWCGRSDEWHDALLMAQPAPSATVWDGISFDKESGKFIALSTTRAVFDTRESAEAFMRGEAAARIAAPRTSRVAELESAVDAADRILAMFIEKRLPVEAWQDWRRTHRAALCDSPTAPGAEKGTNDERAGSTRAEGSASDQGHVGHLDHMAGAERGQPTQPSRCEGAAGDPERSVAPRDAALRALVETWRKASRDLAADTPMARGQVRVLRLVADELDATLAALPPEVCSECGHSLKQHGRLGCGFLSCDCGISGERR